MEENFEQISEGENYPNYNYEEFVRTITKEDNTISKRNKFEEYEYKDYQKEFYFNSTQSSDVTSISFSQTEHQVGYWYRDRQDTVLWHCF